MEVLQYMNWHFQQLTPADNIASYVSSINLPPKTADMLAHVSSDLYRLPTLDNAVKY